jgi:hypothetical protein
MYRVQIAKLQGENHRIIQQRDTLLQKEAEINQLRYAHLLEKNKTLTDQNELLASKCVILEKLVNSLENR